jgi:hypothetical protein
MSIEQLGAYWHGGPGGLNRTTLARNVTGVFEPLGYVNAGAERHHKPIPLWRSRLFPARVQR